MSDEPIIFHSEESIPKPKPGYYAEVRYVKIDTTKDAVLDKLINMDRHTAKVGDILDLQILAKAALDGSEELGESTPEHLSRTNGSQERTDRD